MIALVLLLITLALADKASDIEKLFLINACNQLEVTNRNWQTFKQMCQYCHHNNLLSIPMYEQEFICNIDICKDIDVFAKVAQDKFNTFMQKHNLEKCPWPLNE